MYPSKPSHTLASTVRAPTRNPCCSTLRSLWLSCLVVVALLAAPASWANPAAAAGDTEAWNASHLMEVISITWQRWSARLWEGKDGDLPRDSGSRDETLSETPWVVENGDLGNRRTIGPSLDPAGDK